MIKKLKKWFMKIFSKLLKPIVLNILNQEWTKLSQ